MPFHYPLAAVVGAEPLKLALCLAAIDPKVGGVLIEGPRGMAKSTLARGLADLLEGAPFVTLPLGASEDRVVGTLDLDAALGQGEVRFSPGVLAKADGGVLYVDEVNLLPDPLVDVLLDVAASGINRVERDGVSHQHPARFVLIGTMNPEEGALRPQLLDRFGLNVALEDRPDPLARQAIIRRRLAFDSDPAAFCDQWQSEQAALSARCRDARVRLDAVPLSDDALGHISKACHDAGVDGLRADLVWLRAARAHAAWRGASTIERQDIDAVADFALRHRRQPHRADAPLPPPPPPEQRQPPTGESNPHSGTWGQLPAQAVPAGPRTGLPEWPKKQ